VTPARCSLAVQKTLYWKAGDKIDFKSQKSEKIMIVKSKALYIDVKGFALYNDGRNSRK
jgi:hypothetical protein